MTERARPPRVQPPSRPSRLGPSLCWGAHRLGSSPPTFLSHSFLPRPFPFTLRLPISPSPKMAGLLGEGTELAEGCPGPRWRGQRQRGGAAASPGQRVLGRLRERLGGGVGRGALWGGGGGLRLGRVVFGGSRPWLPGSLFRPASWSISRARTFTAVAIARTSREVAPMVSRPAGRRGRAPRPGGLCDWRASPGVAAPRLGPTGSWTHGGWNLHPAPVSWSECGAQLPREGRGSQNLKWTSPDAAGKLLGVYSSHRRWDMRDSDCLAIAQSGNMSITTRGQVNG